MAPPVSTALGSCRLHLFLPRTSLPSGAALLFLLSNDDIPHTADRSQYIDHLYNDTTIQRYNDTTKELSSSMNTVP
ncbi:uncharacterized protein BT62DRAFT_1004680 [Guyanagaster necrorhizus]|uniref:Uncharacterized protein n=1 Tax=Guyanagaster necrorhizus TaxID=856835 RepID=A0A9P7VVA3_9AGAR|nr:uncharacterized protein BT62DRAFT_1004680 [Guyanagaster necrorhizus MCA 3950]KAG7447105.1 hypothetical protein BT62DRAFT_1004680 [Guyanagaster necrorhizus MCA 3950]